MSRQIVDAIVATSRPLEVYSGVEIPESTLEQLAERLRSGAIPMLFNHDPSRPLDAKILDARVHRSSDGYSEVRVTFDVDADDWNAVRAEIDAAGAPGGFSFAYAEPMTTLAPLPGVPEERIDIAADASHWTDEDRLAAAEHLRASGSVSISRRYEFAVDPNAVVFVAIAVNLVSSILYDALKNFLFSSRRNDDSAAARARRKTTDFHFRLRRPTFEVEARLKTSDETELREAIEALPDVDHPSGTPALWDPVAKRWTQD